MEFSSEGFDLDAIGDQQQQQQQQAQESQDVIYEIGGGATRIPVPSAGATNQDNNDQNTTNSRQGDRQKNDDKVDADDSLRQANEYKEQGNAAFRQRDWLLAYDLYSEAIAATPGHPTGMELLQLQKEWQQQQHLSARQALHERDEAERRKTKLEQQRQRQRTDQQPLPQTTENDSSATNDDETTTAPVPREENEQPPNEKQPEEEDKPPSVFEPPRHEHGESLAVYHCNRSAALLALERYSEAVQDCDMAILLNPTYLKAFVRRCQAHEQLEQYDLALADAQTVVKLASSSSTNVTKAQRQSYQRTVQRLQRLEDERLEQLKTETMAKLKDLGNSILGNFGLSLDNFKAVQDPNTGSYSISFDQSNNKSSSS
ncbi:hypothetical protein ACA910_009324 [Epithemia clementina (nom. ined.)]